MSGGKPKLLDLFCGAGGAAKGYQLAGWHVTGVDNRPQPHYVGDEFIQADALTFPLEGFDAIHASPPCQAYSQATAWRGDRASHPRLILPTRKRLVASGLRYVIENVTSARGELHAPIMLCGSVFGLPVRSHRYFEVPWLLLFPTCQHSDDDHARDHGGTAPESEFGPAMGIDWMTVLEAREAIPPAYTELIGLALLQDPEAHSRYQDRKPDELEGKP